MTLTQLLSMFGARWRSALVAFGVVLALVAASTNLPTKEVHGKRSRLA